MTEEQSYFVHATFEVIANSKEAAIESFEKGMGDLIDIYNVEALDEL